MMRLLSDSHKIDYYYKYRKKRVPQASAHSSPQELQNTPSADTQFAAPNLKSSSEYLIFRKKNQL